VISDSFIGRDYIGACEQALNRLSARIFLAFLAGSLLFGIPGALIPIPAANIIRIVVRKWILYQQAKRTIDLPDAMGAPSRRPWTGDQVEALE
jgi:hypothetical protein